jgi:hypothetical protein
LRKVFVDRDQLNGRIVGMSHARRHEGQQEIADDAPELLAYFSTLRVWGGRAPENSPSPPSIELSPPPGIGRNVKIAADGCLAAVGDGVTNDLPALQAHADWLAAHGGGWLDIPGGIFKVSSPGLVLRGQVSVRGGGLGSQISSLGQTTALTLDNTGSHRLQDIFLIGYQGANPISPTLVVQTNAEVYIDRIRSWYGSTGLLMHGNDGTIKDSFFWSRGSCVQNHGSNWWLRCKFDDDGVNYTPYSFISGPNTPENYFVMCDFSGNFGHSFSASGVTGAFLKFTDCVFSSPIDVQGVGWAKFDGCTFGSSLNASGAAVTVANSYSLAPLVVNGALKALSNNLNIS